MGNREIEKIKAQVREKILAGEGLSKDLARKLFSLPLTHLGELAQLMRFQIHPEKIVTYVVDRNINYTNICISRCKFCAFYKVPSSPEGYLLSFEEIAQKIEETLALGGYQILLQGGLHPDLSLEYYENLFSFIKKRFPQIHLHALSPPEIIFLSRRANLEVNEVLKRLMEAGLDSIPGGGAEILVDRVRKIISPNKCSAEEWLLVMETAHTLGLKTTATMMFGHIETEEEILEHLFKIRDLQSRTHGFTAFIPWTFQPQNTALSHIKKVGSARYLQILAISRVVLHNVPNIQVSWVTQGPKIAQLALEFGGNDFGSTMIEENVVASTGVYHRLTEEEIRQLITEAGYLPKRRKMDYTSIE
ncbi:MAG: dehypoxanthine futalosine cyclase [Caldimicrobium sp.]|nr:dehypoxanthine futalosine cyclase [Caldimicrobium sp.]MCX7873088.1 dehypoxanthine futalosine cyclase [Caldimicrobium sp.]MDW8094513.1 cyclic dehypoxanthinyl futalosine synthase [Caldimicrobium sp.]